MEQMMQRERYGRCGNEHVGLDSKCHGLDRRRRAGTLKDCGELKDLKCTRTYQLIFYAPAVHLLLMFSIEG